VIWLTALEKLQIQEQIYLEVVLEQVRQEED
jgi:hypothetical protein